MRRPSGQRGIFLIFTALAMVGLLGFVGLAIDSSRQQVVRSELQNAADACALAASSELTGGAAAVNRAIAAGRYVVFNGRNKKNFQDEDISSVTIEFNDTLPAANSPAPAGWTISGSNSSRFVRCTVNQPNLVNYFMGVLGVSASDVSAFAIATVHPAQSMCALPMSACSAGAGSDFGFTVNQILSMDESDMGFFRWVEAGLVDGAKVTDFNRAIKGSGVCEIPTRTDSCIGFHTGTIASLIEGWNSRFGMYKSGVATGPADGVGDRSGFSFREKLVAPKTTLETHVPANWFGFLANRTDFQGAYAEVVSGSFVLKTSADANWNSTWRYALNPYSENTSFRAPKRRVVEIPVLDCAGGAPASCSVSGGKRVLGRACVLMLSPRVPATSDKYQVAYLGNASSPSSECYGVGAGVPGGVDAAGPLVPVLVQ
jgi:hypothetical protein